MTLIKRLFALVLGGGLAVALTLFACARMQPPIPNLSPSGRGVIFPASVASEFAKQCSRADVVGNWTYAPSRSEVKALETALPKWMETVPLVAWDKSFDAYHYQYGAIERGDQRLIYINAVPASEAEHWDWERKPESVCDGGPNFWGVEWDVKTGKFQNESFNGSVD